MNYTTQIQNQILIAYIKSEYPKPANERMSYEQFKKLVKELQQSQ